MEFALPLEPPTTEHSSHRYVHAAYAAYSFGQNRLFEDKTQREKEKREVLKAHGAKRDQKIVKLLQKRGH